MPDKPKHRHAGHRERMKAEFLARGLEGWPDHRVLELLLFYTIPQGDVNDLAHELVERFGSLAGVLDASVEELKKVKGVGDHTAVFLRMLPAVLGRYQGARTRLSAIINSPEEAYAWLEPYFFGARNEMVYVLCLDGKRQVLGVRKVAEGSIELAEVNTRRIAEEAIGLRGRPDLRGPQPREQPGHPLPGGLADHRHPPGRSAPHRHRAHRPPGVCGRRYGVLERQ